VGDVGKDFLLVNGSDSVQVRCTAYIDATQLTVYPRTIVPASMRGTAGMQVYRCTNVITGLTHLEGATVGIVAGQGVEPSAVVSGGQVTLSRYFARVRVGIPITSTAKTLDLEASDQDTNLGDFKHVTRVILRFERTRGAEVGLSATTLEPMANEFTTLINAPPALQSGVREILMDAAHTDSGSFIMQQDSGLPTTILNARPVFNIGNLR
jgi:hypothetical protein